MRCVFVLFMLVGAAWAKLQLGTFTQGSNVNCPNGYATGAACKKFTVSNCPGVATITGKFGFLNPPAPYSGAVILHAGGGGTAAFDNGYVNLYYTAGLRIVQVTWDTDWEDTDLATKSIKLASCRGDTFVNWIASYMKNQNPTLPVCYHGQSGGAGLLGYLMAHGHGPENLDYGTAGTSPVFGRIDQGCQVPYVPAITVYSNTQYGFNQPYLSYSDAPQYAGGHGGAMTTWTGADCAVAGTNTSPAQNQAWWDMSIVSAGANYTWPQTYVTQWVCNQPTNNSPAQGAYFAAQMTAANHGAGFRAFIVTGCSGAESVWTGQYTDPVTGVKTVGRQAQANDLIANCVARHV